ncbi:glucose-6-phosphate dehydrogenase assembly protein OpcA [Cryobacterium sp. MP_M5]|uniref:glucose-6-phosphate dehydrogenase assembly protein OpcA n=1 Tax=unclassified Cryobacterium TaxID=2649013 RepID=UPI0018CA1AD8|nr:MULTISPECIES: glucose-6-phosphate dehydrogenase assembly protein OpcA [unclassified Cryobacterium]MBG6058710.1 glucose-6-phosphate dehydrogenase assembly protein OpcA [Cryobacterium sp. MP_M3]MEC5176811.1 glucose-6-phosphate dehydrogenase assembly protein OpcA [Cryobacterium sp. MP_M5]
MIVDLPDTTTSKISKALVRIREEGGAVALGRVLTLIIASTMGHEEEAIEAANDASREHPMRVIVVSTQALDDKGLATTPRIDAEIRVGGDAGASEVIVLRAYGEAASDPESLVTGLLLPDAPVVAWWPGVAPAVPAESPLGRIAYRRITDASAQLDPQAALHHLCTSYRPGDTDFAWTRLTLWRAQLAAVLDQPPYQPVTAVQVSGASDSPSTALLAAWLQLQLQVPVSYEFTTDPLSSGIRGVHLTRAAGVISLEREVPGIATLTQPGQPVQDLTLKRRSLRDCLSDELRRLDPDELYGEVITRGLPHLDDVVADQTEGRP